MHDYLTRLISGYAQAHGHLPNLLYLNSHHIRELQHSYDDTSLQQIMTELDMSLIIDNYATHPHVCWNEVSARAVC